MGPGDTPYCIASDLTQYLPAAVLNQVSSAQQDQACLDATTIADSHMRGRYEMPLLEWDSSVRMHTAWIACYLIAQLIGFAGQAGSDRQITERYYIAIGWPDKPGTGWFPGIQRQAIHPNVTPTVPSPGNAVYDLPQVRSAPLRGWQQTVGGKPVV